MSDYGESLMWFRRSQQVIVDQFKAAINAWIAAAKPWGYIAGLEARKYPPDMGKTRRDL